MRCLHKSLHKIYSITANTCVSWYEHLNGWACRDESGSKLEVRHHRGGPLPLVCPHLCRRPQHGTAKASVCLSASSRCFHVCRRVDVELNADQPLASFVEAATANVNETQGSMHVPRSSWSTRSIHEVRMDLPAIMR